MESKSKLQDLAIQYFEGTISKQDEQILFEFINQNSSNYSKYRLWEKEWSANNIPNERTDKEWQALLHKIHTRESINKTFSNAFSFNSWRKIAAVAIILIAFAGSMIGFWDVLSPSPENNFLCEAPLGNKSRLFLPDGTEVWLNAGSQLRYSNEFNSSDRVVELSGEAYFQVTKRQGKKFTVKTRGYDVIVHGTKFDISAYPDDPYVLTSLLEGKVEIDYKNMRIFMSPGESAKLNLQTGKLLQCKMNANQSKSWTEDMIEYDNISIYELSKKLSRQYNVNINIESREIGSMRFYISLHNKETIEQVMYALTKIVPIHVGYRGKDIYIRK
jgi:transmembrane sensor